jgi:hypothetical protein
MVTAVKTLASVVVVAMADGNGDGNSNGGQNRVSGVIGGDSS